MAGFVVAKVRPLTREDEHHLALRAKSGDLRARNRLVEQMLPLVVGMATKLSRAGVRLDDLVQEGNLGLLRAVEKFDPHAGTRFSTYAVWWVRALLVKYLKQARSVVRPRAIEVAQHDVSLDEPLSEDSEATRGDLLEDHRERADRMLLRARADAGVRAALARVRKRLGPVRWDIVENRLSRDEPHTLEMVADRHGLSRERIRQVEMKTVSFLAAYLARALPGAEERPDRPPASLWPLYLPTAAPTEKEETMPKGLRAEPCKGCGSRANYCACMRAAKKGAPAKKVEAPARAAARVVRAKPGAFNAVAASVEDLVATIEACQEELRNRKAEVAEQLAAIEKAIGAAA